MSAKTMNYPCPQDINSKWRENADMYINHNYDTGPSTTPHPRAAGKASSVILIETTSRSCQRNLIHGKRGGVVRWR